MSNLSRYKADLKKLIELGLKLKFDIVEQAKPTTNPDDEHKNLLKELNGIFGRKYQNWYTEASAIIRQMLPDRLDEFQKLYKGDGKRKGINLETYNIQDWLNGVRASEDAYLKKRFADIAIVAMRVSTQLAILESLETRFESSLHDIQQLVQADLFDSELDAASELLKSGFYRAAGAVAGVVLEKHLAQVASNHSVSTKKQHPTICDYNDLLKGASVLDVPAWRNIQRLGDLRNLCDHNKHRDPTKEEVDELVRGVEKLTKTLF